MAIFWTFKARVYATPTGYRRLDDVLAGNRRLYNALLQQRRDAYGRQVPVMYTDRDGKQQVGMRTRPHDGASVTLSKGDQGKGITAARQDHIPGVSDVSRRIVDGTNDRADRAFKAFFRRLKSGQKPGYPRFKGEHRFNTLEANAVDWVDKSSRPPRVGEGWFALPKRIRVPGLPILRLRKDIPEGAIVGLRLTKRGRCWYVALCIKMDDSEAAKLRLPPTGAVVGLDMGITDRVHTSDGKAYPRVVDNFPERRKVQRKMARLAPKPGHRASRGYKAARAELNKLTAKDANRRRDTAHKITREVVNGYDFIGIEDLPVARMMRSAAGTVDSPGRNVAQKRGLNLGISQQGWGQVREFLQYKAEWAGRQIIAVTPVNTSRTCAECGEVSSMSRRGKRFVCIRCGYEDDADHNAALDILRDALAVAQAGEAKSPGAYKAGNSAGSPRKPPRQRRQGRAPPPPTPGAIQGSLPA